jgi:hypothetical protein
MGCTDEAGDPVCSCHGNHISSPVALEVALWAASARRAVVKEKLTRAASLSHAIVGRESAGIRPISLVVQ